AEQIFSRSAGAPLVAGNCIRLLTDAEENYPAWIDRLNSANTSIHLEMYIIHEDEIGRRFADILIRKAREGVRVRVLYDWLGGFFKASNRYWKRLLEAGVEVRCFNPPRLDSPFGWLSRDHRKVIVVDSRIAFVTGLCIGQMWLGHPDRGIGPWRDTGVEIIGPAVADIEAAFAEVWAIAGEPLPPEEVPDRERIEPAGQVNLRVIATVPTAAGLYRLDNLVAALARRSLWLSDAYFIGVSSYVQALRSAALDGVDVRLLVPGSTDIPALRALSRAGYGPLLEAGVRVFEWNGSMMHAKTAVADGMWARVGSTNLNIASWMGNYELDVAVEDAAFAKCMEEKFLNDLENCTEVVLGRRNRVALANARPRTALRRRHMHAGSVGRAGAGTIRLGYTVGAALTEHRLLGHAEAKVTAIGGVLLFIVTLAGLLWPLSVAIPVSVLCGWLSLSLLVRTYKMYFRKTRKRQILKKDT
ncbi:MAG: phospholipase D-like domain-containing protein, partial [Desulforhabdus sp.]|nr:phospholipase D-like domain-containing protein [Desulforhabdus sp.]